MTLTMKRNWIRVVHVNPKPPPPSSDMREGHVHAAFTAPVAIQADCQCNHGNALHVVAHAQNWAPRYSMPSVGSFFNSRIGLPATCTRSTPSAPDARCSSTETRSPAAKGLGLK